MENEKEKPSVDIETKADWIMSTIWAAIYLGSLAVAVVFIILAAFLEWLWWERSGFWPPATQYILLGISVLIVIAALMYCCRRK